MAFEHKIFSKSDQQVYDQFHFKNTLNTFRYPSVWEVDEEKEAFMVCFGGYGGTPLADREPPTFYALVWNTHIIYFEGRYRVLNEEAQIGFNLNVTVPKHLEEEIAAIKEAICAALLSKEKQGPLDIDTITVNFDYLLFK